MSGPVYGGQKSLKDSSGNQGVYAAHPAGTPKFNAGSGQSTQARMYVAVPDQAAYENIIDALPNAQARAYAQAVLRPGDSASNKVYIDILIQSVSTQYSEKVQVSEVLSDAFIAYFFGQRAISMSIQGTLLNTQQDNWADAWYILYQSLLRGTKLAEIGYPVTFMYDSRIVECYILNLSESMNSNVETSINFNMSLLVKKISVAPTYLRPPTDVSQVSSLVGSLTLSSNNALAEDGSPLAAMKSTVSASIDAANAEVQTNAIISEILRDIREGADASELEEQTGFSFTSEEVDAPNYPSFDLRGEAATEFDLIISGNQVRPNTGYTPYESLFTLSGESQ
jgi:hypothetical protein